MRINIVPVLQIYLSKGWPPLSIEGYGATIKVGGVVRVPELVFETGISWQFVKQECIYRGRSASTGAQKRRVINPVFAPSAPAIQIFSNRNSGDSSDRNAIFFVFAGIKHNDVIATVC
jgi:hypothetical protein